MVKTYDVPKFGSFQTVCQVCGMLLVDDGRGGWKHFDRARQRALVTPHTPVPVTKNVGPGFQDHDSFDRSSRSR